jgi:ComF family protein
MSLQRLFDVFNRIFLCECLLCESPKLSGEGLCPSCVSMLPLSGPRCPGCGEHQVTHLVRCPRCLLTPFSFDSLVTVFDYRDPIPSLVKQLKFNRKLEWGRLLGYYLGKRLQIHYQERALPSVIIPVPLSTERLIERGFNQALELALPLRRLLNIPLEVNAVYRSRHTRPINGK